MNELVNYVISTAGGATGVLLLGYLCRTQLNHWLNADLEKRKVEFQRELESDKAKHQQQLEAYRMSLLAEVERIKAQQSAKLAGATKIVERKYTAFEALSKASHSLAALAISALTPVPPAGEERDRVMKSINGRLAAIVLAVEDAAPFLLDDQYAMILDLNTSVGSLLRRVTQWDPATPGPITEDIFHDLIMRQNGVNRMLGKIIDEMMRME